MGKQFCCGRCGRTVDSSGTWHPELCVPCGLPQQQPLWVDYADGSVPFWSTVFARPGIVGAAANFIVPPQLRAGGAKTVYFDLNFHNRMGSPSSPVDPQKLSSASGSASSNSSDSTTRGLS